MSLLRSTVFAALYLVFFSSISAASGFPSGKLDRIVSDFEIKNSISSVVIIDSKTAFICYLYNPEYAVSRRFPPGSIAKVWTAAVLLENPGIVNFDPKRIINCSGRFIIKDAEILTNKDRRLFNLQEKTGETSFKCAIRAGHGNTDLHHALVRSCNVYFLTWASVNPNELYRKTVSFWHLDKETGLKSSRYREPPYVSVNEFRLTRFQACAAAIGEGGAILVSPLKAAQTFAALIEGTPLLKPHEKQAPALEMCRLNVSRSTRNKLMTALSQVIHSGTLKDLNVKNGSVKIVAGKTGTGTHYRKKFLTHAWNVIYFKYKLSSYVMCVFVNKGRGGETAKSLSMEILNAL